MTERVSLLFQQELIKRVLIKKQERNKNDK